MTFTGKSTIPFLVSGRCGVPVETIEKVLDAWDWVLLNELQQGKAVRIAGCGILQMKTRAARRKRLPGGEAFIVPEKRALAFRQTRTLEEALTPGAVPQPLRGRPRKRSRTLSDTSSD